MAYEYDGAAVEEIQQECLAFGVATAVFGALVLRVAAVMSWRFDRAASLAAMSKFGLFLGYHPALSDLGVKVLLYLFWATLFCWGAVVVSRVSPPLVGTLLLTIVPASCLLLSTVLSLRARGWRLQETGHRLGTQTLGFGAAFCFICAFELTVVFSGPFSYLAASWVFLGFNLLLVACAVRAMDDEDVADTCAVAAGEAALMSGASLDSHIRSLSIAEVAAVAAEGASSGGGSGAAGGGEGCGEGEDEKKEAPGGAATAAERKKKAKKKRAGMAAAAIAAAGRADADAPPRGGCLRASAVWWTASVAVLGAYICACVALSGQYTSVPTAITVLVLDACVWLLFKGRLISNASVMFAVMGACRIALLSTGEQYWFLGHCLVFVLAGSFIVHVVVGRWNTRAAADAAARAAKRKPLWRSSWHQIAVQFIFSAWYGASVACAVLVGGEAGLATPGVFVLTANHEQYEFGVAAVFLVLGCTTTVLRVFERAGGRLECAGIAAAGFAIVLIAGAGVLVAVLTRSYFVLFSCICLPTAGLALALLYSHWVEDDFVLFFNLRTSIRPRPARSCVVAPADPSAVVISVTESRAQSVAHRDRLKFGQAGVFVLGIAGFVTGLVLTMGDKWWLGPVVGGAVLTLVFTAVPVKGWFNTFTARPSFVVCGALAAGCHLATHYFCYVGVAGEWVPSATGQPDQKTAVLLSLCVYPCAVAAGVSLFAWRDARWVGSLRVFRALGSSLVVMAGLLAWGCVAFASAGTTTFIVLAAVGCVLVLVFGAKWAANGYYLVGPWRTAALAATAAAVTGASIAGIVFAAAGAQQEAVAAFSAALGVSFVFCVLAGFSALHGRGSDGSRLILSETVFPVYRFDPYLNMLVDANAGATLAVAAVGLAFVWGIMACIVLSSKYIGLIVCSSTMTLTVALFFDVLRQPRLELRAACDVLAAGGGDVLRRALLTSVATSKVWLDDLRHQGCPPFRDMFDTSAQQRQLLNRLDGAFMEGPTELPELPFMSKTGAPIPAGVALLDDICVSSHFERYSRALSTHIDAMVQHRRCGGQCMNVTVVASVEPVYLGPKASEQFVGDDKELYEQAARHGMVRVVDGKVITRDFKPIDVSSPGAFFNALVSLHWADRRVDEMAAQESMFRTMVRQRIVRAAEAEACAQAQSWRDFLLWCAAEEQGERLQALGLEELSALGRVAWRISSLRAGVGSRAGALASNAADVPDSEVALVHFWYMTRDDAETGELADRLEGLRAEFASDEAAKKSERARLRVEAEVADDARRAKDEGRACARATGLVHIQNRTMTAEQREASLRAAIAEVEQRVMREMHDQEMYERDSVRKRLAAEAEVQSKIEDQLLETDEANMKRILQLENDLAATEERKAGLSVSLKHRVRELGLKAAERVAEETKRVRNDALVAENTEAAMVAALTAKEQALARARLVGFDSEDEDVDAGVDKTFETLEATLTTIAKDAAREKHRFVDAEFDPAIAIGDKDLSEMVSGWCRPEEFYAEYELAVNNFSAGDMCQGDIGDGWLLSAFALVAQRPDLLRQVFPSTLRSSTGAYGVRLFKNGKWVPVVVDDKFACKAGFFRLGNGDLFKGAVDRMATPPRYAVPVFASARVRSREVNELWMMVLEKAFAKYHGGYSALVGGRVSSALVDLTGGLSEAIDLESLETRDAIASGALWARLQQYAANGYLLGAGAPSGKSTVISQDGIVPGHAYGILRLAEETDTHGSHKLIQIRNPWGRTEWNGAWSDGDVFHWTQRMKTKLQYFTTGTELDNDGIFWMQFGDCCRHFQEFYVCRTFATVAEGGVWHKYTARGAWQDQTAGGTTIFPSAANNTQYYLTPSATATVVVSLAQPDSKGLTPLRTIGIYIVYKEGKRCLKRYAGQTIAAAPYAGAREVSCEVKLVPAAHPYTLFVSTYEPGEESPYTITVYSTAELECKPNNVLIPIPDLKEAT